MVDLDLRWRTIIVVTATMVCCLLPALLLYFVGYIPGLEWNGNSLETTCRITDHLVTGDTCSYSCHCYSSTTSRHCSTCYYTCYDGSIVVDYSVNNVTYNNIFEVYSNKRNEGDVYKKLNKKYPIGSDTNCYYNENNPYDSRLKEINTDVFLAFFIIFCCLGIILLFGWIGFEVYNRSGN